MQLCACDHAADEQIYQKILQSYYDSTSNSDQIRWNEELCDQECLSHVVLHDPNSESYDYTFLDLNDDNINELIILAHGDGDYSPNRIWGIYTQQEGSAILVAKNDDIEISHGLFLLKDKIIMQYNEDSTSWQCAYLRMDTEGCNLKPEQIITYEQAYNGSHYFYNYYSSILFDAPNGGARIDYPDDFQIISEEQAMDINDAYQQDMNVLRYSLRTFL